MDYTKYLGEAGLAELWNLMTAYVNKKIFIGTLSEYEAAASTIPVGAIVVLIDENNAEIPPVEDDTTSSTAVLGTALLGSMLLGQL